MDEEPRLRQRADDLNSETVAVADLCEQWATRVHVTGLHFREEADVASVLRRAAKLLRERP